MPGLAHLHLFRSIPHAFYSLRLSNEPMHLVANYIASSLTSTQLRPHTVIQSHACFHISLLCSSNESWHFVDTLALPPTVHNLGHTLLHSLHQSTPGRGQGTCETATASASLSGSQQSC